MRVFVTGASGHIGSAVIPELLAAGHQVTGLARSDSAAAVAQRRGRDGAARHDRRPRPAAVGRRRGRRRHPPGVQARGHALRATCTARPTPTWRPIEAMLDALAGTGKPFVGTSGTLLLAMVALGPDRAPRTIAVPGGPRIDAENLTIETAARGVRTSVVRLPPTVHSSLDHHGFIPTLIGMARANGAAAYVGDGANRWPAGHTLDAARLYRLALESAPAGSRLHAVGDEGVPFREIAEAIGRNLGLPAVEHRARGGRPAPRLPRRLRPARQPDLERADPQAAGLGADPPRADRGHGRGSLLPQLNGYRRQPRKRLSTAPAGSTMGP